MMFPETHKRRATISHSNSKPLKPIVAKIIGFYLCKNETPKDSPKAEYLFHVHNYVDKLITFSIPSDVSITSTRKPINLIRS